MTEFSKVDARDALACLAEKGQVIALTEPARIAAVLNGSLDECARLAAQNADLLERLRAIRQTVSPHLRERTQRGELARDVEAEADPHPEPAA